jgi:hypothetical protein
MEEALESGAEQVNNVVHSFRLQKTQFDKKSYLSHLKEYMKAIKTKLQETNPERVPEFEKGAAAFAKKIVGGFKDWEFYTGESMDINGMVALLVCLFTWHFLAFYPPGGVGSDEDCRGRADVRRTTARTVSPLTLSSGRTDSRR